MSLVLLPTTLTALFFGAVEGDSPSVSR